MVLFNFVKSFLSKIAYLLNSDTDNPSNFLVLNIKNPLSSLHTSNNTGGRKSFMKIYFFYFGGRGVKNL